MASWLTTAASGRFAPALSAPGRIVVAATEPDGETNETEFPLALAEVSLLPVEKLDLDRDGRVSVREIHRLAEVVPRYLTATREDLILGATPPPTSLIDIRGRLLRQIAVKH